MATIELVMASLAKRDLIEMNDFNNFHLLNNGLDFTNGGFVFFHKFIIKLLKSL